MANDVVRRLKAVREEIANRTRERDRLEGRRDVLRKTLKDDYGLDSLGDARRKVDEMDAELDAEEKRIEAELSKLEKELR